MKKHLSRIFSLILFSLIAFPLASFYIIENGAMSYIVPLISTIFILMCLSSILEISKNIVRLEDRIVYLEREER
ncbi:MAG: hypothetical protein KKF57_05035 [Firmicutes bacterium]|nr:hypothetical protein [Bacillota bacterium]